MRTLVIVAALALAGCGEDKETLLAQCQMDPQSSRVGLMVCMSSKGYAMVINEECLRSAMTNNLPVQSCYEKRGLWRSARHFVGMP